MNCLVLCHAFIENNTFTLLCSTLSKKVFPQSHNDSIYLKVLLKFLVFLNGNELRLLFLQSFVDGALKRKQKPEWRCPL